MSNNNGGEIIGSLLVALGVVGGYVYVWYQVNLSASTDSLLFVWREVSGLFSGKHSPTAYTLAVVAMAGFFLQIRTWIKKPVEERARWEPFYWPFWIAASSGVIAFFAGSGSLALNNTSDYLKDLWSKDFVDMVFIVIGGVIMLIIVGVAAALKAAFLSGLYSSAVIHFPVFSLTFGVLIAIATWLTSGEINLLIMYTNFLDGISYISDSAKGWVAILSLITAFAAALYRGIMSFHFIEFD